MAFHTLGVHRALQPWRIAGLRHWLMDSEEALLAVRTPAAPVPAVRAVPAAPAAAHGTSSPLPASPTSSSAPAAPAAQLRSTSPQPRHEAAPTPQEHAPQAVLPLPEAPATLPVQKWPEAWRELLSRCPRTPVVLWTYPAMREDYGGRSDPARRALLQRLLRDLSMPPGSHAFWPLSAPPYDDPDNQRIDPLFFHSGVEQLSPLVVVFFGPPPEELGLPAISALIPEIHLGRRLVHVPSTDTLAANLATGAMALPEGAGRHERLVQFLKSQISGLIS